MSLSLIKLYNKLPESIRQFLDKNGQTVLNIIVFIGIADWVIRYTVPVFTENRVNFVEIAFLGHNVIMLFMIIARKRHKAVDSNFYHQMVAMAAFYSGLLFQDTITNSPDQLLAARIVISVALMTGIISFFNLGRSFGILIAFRDIKTGGLYRIVRHPMYLTDIIWKIGMLLKKPCWINAGICLFSILCYAYRALLEEKFLSRQEEYTHYMEKVRYRFIPGIF